MPQSSRFARLAFMASALLLPACSSAPANVRVEMIPNLGYVVRDGNTLGLDLYVPEGPRTKPLPAVLWIHGGAWRSGSRNDAAYIRALAQRGFVGVSIDHRLSMQAPYPAALDDVKAAVRWVRMHAAEYGIDPDRIGLWGASSGGHLALMVACGDDAGGEISSRVQAACTWFAPTDLSKLEAQPMRDSVQFFLGDSIYSQKARAASPFRLASADDPPILLIHGEEDIQVPPSHSRTMAEALERAGANVKLVLVKHAMHGFESFGGEAAPSKEEILEQTIEFFEDTLK